MNSLEEARIRWLAELPRQKAFAETLEQKIREAVQPLGVWFDVSSRVKEIDSLLKKLIKKPKHTYRSLPDKVGVRVAVRYRSDIAIVVKAVCDAIDYQGIDPKVPNVDAIGYLSVHLDGVRLRKDDPERKFYPYRSFKAEVQIRTLAQHLWSEMSHDSIYKSDETAQSLSEDIKRRAYLMAGQLEIADREFDAINAELPVSEHAQLLKFLEPYYYKLTSRRPDIELSLQVIERLTPLYKDGMSEAKKDIARFLKAKWRFLEALYSLRQNPHEPGGSPLFFQPEALLIYERLSKDIVPLRRAWTTFYSEKELEELAANFGIGLD